MIAMTADGDERNLHSPPARELGQAGIVKRTDRLGGALARWDSLGSLWGCFGRLMFRWTSLDIVVALQASGQSGRMPQVSTPAGRSRLHVGRDRQLAVQSVPLVI